ncbi:CLUMA_CG004722, isoform A [Clunio marinus]|uniref:CLUMA_CG004722, isoform A n=1 Tax=Clunio marinus TaxID=568069 RepID=A0A1J1HTZ6_9DIPT|nr:CLUMA_CG004722, isoform A [Clunio marinus]
MKLEKLFFFLLPEQRKKLELRAFTCPVSLHKHQRYPRENNVSAFNSDIKPLNAAHYMGK